MKRASERKRVRLGDVCEEIRRLRSLRTKEILYVDISSIDRTTKKIASWTKHKLETAPSRAQQVVQKGDVLVSTVRPNLNGVAIVEDVKTKLPLVASTGFCVLRSNQCQPYIFYFCQTKNFISSITEVSERASYPSVKDADILEQELLLPPLAEQKRIAERLQRQMEKLDELSKCFSDAAAFARQSFQSLLAETFDEHSPALAGEVRMVRLGDVCEIIMGQSPKGETVFDNAGVEGMEFHQGKIFFGNKYLNVSDKVATEPTKIVQCNTLLLCVRAPVGKVNITKREICIGRGLCGIYPNEQVNIDYLYYLLCFYEEIFESKATGTTFKSIACDIIKQQAIPLPPLSEQVRIAKELEKRKAELDKLAALAEEGREWCRKCREALLEEVFGE